MRRHMCLCIIYLLLYYMGALSLYAQEIDTEQWFIQKPIKEITIEGVLSQNRQAVEQITNIYQDKRITYELVDALQTQLYALDLFDEVSIDVREYNQSRDAVNLLVLLQERPLIGDITIVGNTIIRTAKILDEISIKPDDMFIQTQVYLMRDTIIDLYKDEGFSDVSILINIVDGVRFSEEENSQESIAIKNIEYVISEGMQRVVNQIIFSGNERISSNKLRSKLETRQRSLFVSGLFNEANLALDKDNLIEYYHNNGYLDVDIYDIQVEISKTKESTELINYIDITYYVQENTEWYLAKIEFSGNEVFTDQQLNDLYILDISEPVDKSKVDVLYQLVINLYTENGYIYNNFVINEKRDETNDEITYIISITEQSRAYINNIIVSGNEKTKTAVILREIPLQEGEIFNRKKLQQGYQALVNLQYFDTINFTPQPSPDAVGLMDLIIKVEEKSTIQAQVGLSIGGNIDQFPISGRLSLADTNFIGKGLHLGGELNVNPVEQSLSGSYRNDWLFGDRLGLLLKVSLSHNRYKTGLQDVLFPIFSDNDTNAVPDPYTGNFVFTRTTKYNGVEYAAGQLFPGTPSESDITTYSLKTDYAYAGFQVSQDYMMSYNNINLNIGLSLSKTFITSLGKIGLGLSSSVDIRTVLYNKNLYRPFDSIVRNSHNKIVLTPRSGLSFTFDSRDIFISPTKGIFFQQNAQIVYGTVSYYTRFDTNFQAYLSLWNIPVSRKTNAWSWQMVAAFFSSFSILGPLGKASDGSIKPEIRENDRLATNGFNVGRGWSRQSGDVLWDLAFELRMPIVRKFLWFDMFFEAVNVAKTYSTFIVEPEQWFFSFGAGFRLSIQQFPIRIYLGQLFSLDRKENDVLSVDWYDGKLLQSPLSIIFSIGF